MPVSVRWGCHRVGIVYLRATVKRTKRGESVRYLQLAHNERNARGVPVARVIHNFGREDQLDRQALGRLVRSIQRFLGGEETLRASTPEGFRFLGAPEAGGPHVLAPNHLGYRHICVDVPNIQELYQQLSQKWKFLSKPVPVPPPFNVTTVYFIGPGNVLIQLTQKNESGAADG
jgi:hypothetical protein